MRTACSARVIVTPSALKSTVYFAEAANVHRGLLHNHHLRHLNTASWHHVAVREAQHHTEKTRSQ